MGCGCRKNLGNARKVGKPVVYAVYNGNDPKVFDTLDAARTYAAQHGGVVRVKVDDGTA